MRIFAERRSRSNGAFNNSSWSSVQRTSTSHSPGFTIRGPWTWPGQFAQDGAVWRAMRTSTKRPNGGRPDSFALR